MLLVRWQQLRCLLEVPRVTCIEPTEARQGRQVRLPPARLKEKVSLGERRNDFVDPFVLVHILYPTPTTLQPRYVTARHEVYWYAKQRGG